MSGRGGGYLFDGISELVDLHKNTVDVCCGAASFMDVKLVDGCKSTVDLIAELKLERIIDSVELGLKIGKRVGDRDKVGVCISIDATVHGVNQIK